MTKKFRAGKIVAILLLAVTLVQVLAACVKPKPNPTPIDVPVVDMKIIDTYIEFGKSVKLLDAVNDKEAELDVKFLVGKDRRGYSAEQVGYDPSTTVWTPKVANEIYEISVTARNKAGYEDAGDKVFYVVNRGSIRPTSALNTQVFIGEVLRLNQDFSVYSYIDATIDYATVTYIDGKELKTESTKHLINMHLSDPVAIEYTVERAGVHKISITVDSGVNKVTKVFQFNAMEHGAFIDISYLDDLLGHSEYDPVGLPLGKVQENPSLNYRLTRDLDYNDPDSCVDGVIKPWTPIIVSSVNKYTIFTGIIDGMGHTIKGLTNVFPGRGSDIIVTRYNVTRTDKDGNPLYDQTGNPIVDLERGFTYPALDKTVDIMGCRFFTHPSCTGTIRNINIEYETVIEQNDFEEGYQLKIQPTYGDGPSVGVSYSLFQPNFLANYNSGTVAMDFANVNVTGRVFIDATNTATATQQSSSYDYTEIFVSGLANYANSITDTNVDVDIELKNFKNSVTVGGVMTHGVKADSKNLAYSGDIKITMDNDYGTTMVEVTDWQGTHMEERKFTEGFVNVGGVTAVVRGMGNPKIENFESSGTIDITTTTDTATGNTNRINAGGIAASLIGDVYKSSSDMDIKINKLNNPKSIIGGFAGAASAKMYSCGYDGTVTIDDYNSVATTGAPNGSAVGGFVGENTLGIYDSDFSGTVTLGGDGYKELGGMVGRQSSNTNQGDPIVQGCVILGEFNVTGGTLVFGGVTGRTFNDAASIATNLYAATLNAADVSAQSVASGVLGVFRPVAAAKPVITDNSVYGQLNGVAKKYVLVGKLDLLGMFPNPMPTGKYTATLRPKTVESYGEVSAINALAASIATASNFDVKKAVFAIDVKNNRHDAAMIGTDVWIGADPQAELASLEAAFAQYQANLSDKYVYVEVGSPYGSYSGVVLDTYWKDVGAVVMVDGKKYLKIEFKDYPEGSVETVRETGYTIPSSYTPANITASIERYRAFIDELVKSAQALSETQPKE